MDHHKKYVPRECLLTVIIDGNVPYSLHSETIRYGITFCCWSFFSPYHIFSDVEKVSRDEWRLQNAFKNEQQRQILFYSKELSLKKKYFFFCNLGETQVMWHILNATLFLYHRWTSIFWVTIFSGNRTFNICASFSFEVVC